MNNSITANKILSGCKDLNYCLAQYLLSLDEGEQILSTPKLAELSGSSLGSISAALNSLEEIGAVTISRHGRLGSYLKQKSLGKLWGIIENGPMVIALTLPSFPKCEGLATAIYSLLNQAGLETYLIFIRGSINRIKALKKGQCHAAVVSILAADELCTKKEEIILRLPPRTFVTGHRVFYRGRVNKNKKPLRVGIDNDSFDVKYLTELEFAGRVVEYHQMSFVQIDSHLEKSFVDAAVSDLDHREMLLSKEITSQPLSEQTQALIQERNSSAGVVVQSKSTHVKIVLSKILLPESIIDIQKKVEDGLLVPRY